MIKYRRNAHEEKKNQKSQSTECKKNKFILPIYVEWTIEILR